MIGWIKHLDQLLRGDLTRPSALRDGRIDVPVSGLIVLIILLGMLYGVCMGVFALTGSGSGERMQVVASMLKVPALFLLTLVVTFPSLYVFNALVGSRLTFRTVLELLIAAMAVMLAALASLGPIVAFFSLSTTSYPFMLLLNVMIFGAAGFLGLAFLLQTLHRLTISTSQPPPSPAPPPRATPTELGDSPAPAPAPPPAPSISAGSERAGALDRLEGHILGGHVRMVFNIWIIVFGLVGVQMGWVLRPFVGNPELGFTWFRPRHGNFFEAVVQALAKLLGA